MCDYVLPQYFTEYLLSFYKKRTTITKNGPKSQKVAEVEIQDSDHFTVILQETDHLYNKRTTFTGLPQSLFKSEIVVRFL